MLASVLALAANAQAMYFSTSKVSDSTKVANAVTSEVQAAINSRTDAAKPAKTEDNDAWNQFVVPDSVPFEGIFAEFMLPYDTLMMLEKLTPRIPSLPIIPGIPRCGGLRHCRLRSVLWLVFRTMCSTAGRMLCDIIFPCFPRLRKYTTPW